jgi:tetratricopeptide (TPR) repeat protein
LYPLPLLIAVSLAANAALIDGQKLFYNGQYEAAAAEAVSLRSSDAHALAACELQTSALHFQIKRLLGDAADKSKALEQCTECLQLLTDFREAFTAGRSLAQERLKTNPEDEEALFFLGKIDLNHVWLYLGTLGRKTGWNEYREARRSLDTLLKRDPSHVRARVARAWIEYIVDTRVPWAFQWVLGGGDKKKALRTLREAADAESDYFVQIEAAFGLWEMQVRERNIPEAVAIARQLARDFPENRELVRFLAANAP